MMFASVYRAKARAALRNHWQAALIIALIVNLPSLLVQGISAFTGNDFTLRLYSMAMDLSASGKAVSRSDLLSGLSGLLQDTGLMTMVGLGIAAWLVTPCLSLGMNHWALERLRGKEQPVSAVFSRLGIFLKSIGLRLWIALKVLLWMLPGAAVALASLIPILDAEGKSEAELLSAVNTGFSLINIGTFLMLGLGVFGYLHYTLADLILADEPEERILACTRRSSQMMAGRKGALLSLLLSFILWYFLLLLVTSFLEDIVGPVFGLMLQMLGSLTLSVYVLLSEGAFYESLRLQPVQVPSEVA